MRERLFTKINYLACFTLMSVFVFTVTLMLVLGYINVIYQPSGITLGEVVLKSEFLYTLSADLFLGGIFIHSAKMLIGGAVIMWLYMNARKNMKDVVRPGDLASSS